MMATMTPEAEAEWRDALRTMTPAESAKLLLACQHGEVGVRLFNLKSNTTLEADGRDILPLLHDDIVRRMEKSASGTGRGT